MTKKQRFEMFARAFVAGFMMTCALEALASQPSQSSIEEKAELTRQKDQESGGRQAERSQSQATSSFQLANLPVVSSSQVLLLDFDSGTILYEKNADVPMSPSSMTKIATACFVASKIRSGEIDLETPFVVSKNAFRKEGTTMFLNLGQKVSVGDLLEGLIVASANDAAVVLAEGISGSEEVFASELTAFVKSYGALSTHFTNASGLHEPAHKTTARDLAIIATHAIHDYPEIFPLYSQTECVFNGVKQKNRNVLLKKEIGCDGIKTGHTDAGGFGIVATTMQEGRRLLLVLNGCSSESKRAEEAVTLLSWGRRTFVQHHLYKAHSLVTQIPVWYGEESYLPVTVEQDLVVTLPRSSAYDLKILLCYDSPTSAPIQKGTMVGNIQLQSSTMKSIITVPLIASISIMEAGFWKKIKDSITYLIWSRKNPELLDITEVGSSH